jgi:hypothetical protein
MEDMSKITCNCGTVYDRTTVKATFYSRDSFQCLVCGGTLASWAGRSFPTFQVIRLNGWPERALGGKSWPAPIPATAAGF